ncbi:hypothetical protein EI77_03847 [Prosthecobacter fusiformis]|uniref:DUF1330 domain-containing protein n=1 Tax=Prosthecobacter fusiformis TaxID=48464 RepID=A0A4R7RL94_9BACT|nr:hypothetical protein [Prosthecobacter fusiformis]TDU66110.1 hypothetical protein EI77_03847 [Prosthecobacter fusiformis]
MSHLIQLLLPLYANDQKPFPEEFHARVGAELTEKFGGLTAYTRSPAEGRWNDLGQDVRDEIIIYEVMTSSLDEPWWGRYRRTLEARFHQDEVIIRALPMQRL